jgi:hypothetical protein
MCEMSKGLTCTRHMLKCAAYRKSPLDIAQIVPPPAPRTAQARYSTPEVCMMLLTALFLIGPFGFLVGFLVRGLLGQPDPEQLDHIMWRQG